MSASQAESFKLKSSPEVAATIRRASPMSRLKFSCASTPVHDLSVQDTVQPEHLSLNDQHGSRAQH